MQHSFFQSTYERIELEQADVAYWPDQVIEHERYYQQLSDSIAWEQSTITMYGKSMPIPRLNAWYGDEHCDYAYSGITLQPKPWTSELLALKAIAEELANTSFNSVLINWYRDGRDSVSWHSDDEPELGAQPIIASISLGAARRFGFKHKFNESLDTRYIDLAGGSVLVMQGDTQRYWKHMIPKTTKQVAGRINLTFRTILNSGDGASP